MAKHAVCQYRKDDGAKCLKGTGKSWLYCKDHEEQDRLDQERRSRWPFWPQ